MKVEARNPLIAIRMERKRVFGTSKLVVELYGL